MFNDDDYEDTTYELKGTGKVVEISDLGAFNNKASSVPLGKNPAVIPPVSPENHPRDPLHGITLESIINQLVQRHGWGEMGRRIPIRCFQFNPTVKSSLTFLRKTPWARQKVEDWFISELSQK